MKKTEKEIVKYGNSINDTPLEGLRAGGIDLFMALCALMGDEGHKKVTFDYGTLKKMVGLSGERNDYVAKQFGAAAGIINNLRFAVHDKQTGQAVYVTLFPTCINDPESYTLTVRVNEDAEDLLNNVNERFTLFELGQFVLLEGKYSKNLYRLLKQYRKTGTYQVNADRFRKLMDCPEKYPNKEFMRVCINPAIKELSRGFFEDLKVEPIRGSGRGNPIVAYEFTFKKTKETVGQYNLDDYSGSGQEQKQAKKSSGRRQEQRKPKKNAFTDFPQRDNTNIFAQLEAQQAAEIRKQDQERE